MDYQGKRFYALKTKEGDKCPLCHAKIKYCHVGSYCDTYLCGFVDGMALLTKEEAEKYKSIILCK